jgi:hypothetical protein
VAQRGTRRRQGVSRVQEGLHAWQVVFSNAMLLGLAVPLHAAAPTCLFLGVVYAHRLSARPPVLCPCPPLVIPFPPFLCPCPPLITPFSPFLCLAPLLSPPSHPVPCPLAGCQHAPHPEDTWPHTHLHHQWAPGEGQGCV